jgi:predicted NAD-dependent protein-ADP-ribosyltransferase YbiA (DUF1768 family)
MKDLARGLPIPSNWMDIREKVMREVLESKFQNPDLNEKLLNTGDKNLVNANHWGDDFWGVKEKGNGANKMGEILKSIRDIKNSKEKELNLIQTFEEVQEPTGFISKFVKNKGKR